MDSSSFHSSLSSAKRTSRHQQNLSRTTLLCLCLSLGRFTEWQFLANRDYPLELGRILQQDLVAHLQVVNLSGFRFQRSLDRWVNVDGGLLVHDAPGPGGVEAIRCCAPGLNRNLARRRRELLRRFRHQDRPDSATYGRRLRRPSDATRASVRCCVRAVCVLLLMRERWPGVQIDMMAGYLGRD